MRFVNRIPNSSRKLFALFLSAVVLCSAARAQETVEIAAKSDLTGVALPEGAAQLSEQSVPAEIREALKKFVAAGGDAVRQGDTEVLAWTRNYRRANAADLIRQLTNNLQAAGWSFETGNESDGMMIISVSRSAPQKRAIVGFCGFDDKALIVAWTEMVAVNSAPKTEISNRDAEFKTTNSSGASVVLNVEKRVDYVNVMGNQMPAMPQFSALAPKPGRVRGYVKDWTGKPLQGAAIGVRGSYLAGLYSGAQGKTDANGYYEFAIPAGVSHYYNAGYQIEWGEGAAALGLQPADGSLDSFASTDGAVENFVLLPYGVTSRENLQENPHNAATYYGGSIYVGYSAAEAGDQYATPGSVVENSVMEITLTPEDASGKTFVIRKVAGFQTGFYINNIPVGRYRIKATAGGKPLKLKDYKKSNPLFGLNPSEAVGEGTVLFEPNDAQASMAIPQAGGWKSVEIYVSAQ